MVGIALRISLEAKIYLTQKHREKRGSKTPISDSYINMLKREMHGRDYCEVTKDSFCFTVDEMKKLLDEANFKYEETTYEYTTLYGSPI